jgi:hypothetical protein
MMEKHHWWHRDLIRMTSLSKPDPFLQVLVHDLTLVPGLTTLCAAYELGVWRSASLADHLMEWLPEFCLNWSELEGMRHSNSVALMRQAAKRVYQTRKFENRGEFGEILLHAILRQVFDTVPAISKIYYKDGSNDTVKGFDAVHVIATETSLELWLGEVKFYNNISSAIRDVTDELAHHTEADYLKGEFIAIKNKIDPTWPHSERLKDLLHGNKSLDQVFDAACIPVLLTYDSPTTSSHQRLSDQYVKAIADEVAKHHTSFANKGLPKKVKVHLFVVPLATKATLIAALDTKLKAWQQI